MPHYRTVVLGQKEWSGKSLRFAGYAMAMLKKNGFYFYRLLRFYCIVTSNYSGRNCYISRVSCVLKKKTAVKYRDLKQGHPV